MHFISKRAVVLGAVAALGLAGTAQAATDDTSVTLTGGTLAMTAPTFGNFPGAELTGSADGQSASVSDWGVNDPRGSGLGWQVSMSASALVDPRTADDGTDDVTMTGAVLTVAAPDATPVDSSNASTAPTTAGGNISTGVNVAVAAANAGLGDWDLAQGATDLSLATPANARAGTYTSTITTTLTPGV
jgi:hypothetical protein